MAMKTTSVANIGNNPQNPKIPENAQINIQRATNGDDVVPVLAISAIAVAVTNR